MFLNVMVVRTSLCLLLCFATVSVSDAGLNFKKWFKKGNSSNSNAVAEEDPGSTSMTEGSMNARPEQVMDRVALQKKVLSESRERKGKLAYEQGVLLYHQFKFTEALDLFQEASLYLNEDQNVKDYLAKCRQILGIESLGAGHASEWMGEQEKVMIQELKVKGRYHHEKAKDLYQGSQDLWKENQGSEAAVKMLEESLYETRRAKTSLVQLPAGSEKSDHLQALDELTKSIDATTASWNGYIQEQVAEQARKKSMELSDQSRDYDLNRMKTLLIQARRLYLDGKYQESEDLCRIILDEWPKSADAKLILEKSIRHKDKKLFGELKRESEDEWQRNIEKVRSSSIAYAEWLNYSSDWLEIEAKRKKVGDQTEEEPEWQRLMRQKMEKRVTLHLPDNTLNEATEMMREQTGVNFYIDRALDLTDARITELHLNEVRLSAALELILNNVPTESPLLFQFRDEVVFITSKENQGLFNRPVQLLYDVTDLVTSFGEYALGEGAGLNTGKALSGVSEGTSSTEPLSTETLIDLIQVSIDPESWQSDGVSLTEYEAGKIVISHSLVVHEQIQELLEMFRRQQKLQVSIEARFITSVDDDLFDLGVEWKGLPELSLESSASQVGAGAYSTRTNTSSDTRVATVMGSAADSVVAGGPLFITENRAAQGLNAEISVLDPIRASIVLHALSRKQTTKNLIAPRLTVINNRQGYFMNSAETTYVRSFSSQEGNIVPEVSRVSNGELLVVRPTVSSDRKYITLDLSPQVTRLLNLEARSLNVPVRRGGGDGNNNSSTQEIVSVTIDLPNLEVWQLQTRIQVPDGGVVFVGGRMGNIERKTTRAVPLISSIPLLGRLFRSDGDFVELENLIISVRAKILVFDELESKLH